MGEKDSVQDASGCAVVALVGVDERGQLVLPKEIREKAGIRGGDKLAIVAMESDGEVCCLSLIKAERLTDTVRGIIGPVLGEAGV